MIFKFWDFELSHGRSAMPVGTDSLVLGGWMDLEGAAKVLDLGAGCGVLSIVAAHRCPGATVHAVEIDAESASECRDNFSQSVHAHRLHLLEGDLVGAYPDEQFDAIISNPPFYTEGPSSKLERRARARHVGSLGVDELMENAARLLGPDGSFTCVFPYAQEREWISSARSFGLLPSRVLRLENQGQEPYRTLARFERGVSQWCEDKVEIRLSSGKYSPQYIERFGWLHGVPLV